MPAGAPQPDLPRGFPATFPVHADMHRTARYWTAWLLARTFARGFLGRRLHVEGADRVPPTGPLLICSNHLSNVDPPLIGGYLPGANAAMAKREMFSGRLMSWFWGGCNTFPIDRGGTDRWALRTALDLLEHGGRLILFVEGTRAEQPGMKRAEPGVGFLLRRRPVPVLPVAITGTEGVLLRGHRLPRRASVTVRFGTPVELELTPAIARDNQAVADRVGELIAAMLPPAYRGVYAGAVA